MSILQNLIPDPSTTKIWECRPAAIKLTSFAGFTTPGFVSVMKVVGNVIYGMLSTGRNAGNDEPFAYNILLNTFTTISGVTAANTPTSPATSGAWTPPTMDLIGTKLIVTHPGFTGAGGVFFGVLDISNPASPAWSGNNLTGAIVFTTVPSFVRNFNGRAYYIVNPASGTPSVVFSDVLVPTNVTNASQALTFGDTVQLTALGALALFNQLGGIVQSLMVFKGASNIYQITGDAALSNLTLNTLAITTGTFAPSSLAQTPQGLAFMAPDGFRLIDFDARISDPIGVDGQGVTVPFIFSNQPTRVAATSSGSVLRATTQNNNAFSAPFQEYWYDMARKVWHGPHTFPASLIQPYSNTFVMTPVGVTASLWQSDPVQSVTSTFVENGNQMVYDFRTPQLPDSEQMANICVTEATLDAQLSAASPTFTATFLDQFGSAIDAVSVSTPGAQTIWGSFTWGVGTWLGTPVAYTVHQLPWHKPLVFTDGILDIQGNCASGTKIGAIHLRYQVLKTYINTSAAA